MILEGRIHRRNISGCGLAGMMSEDGRLMSGEGIIRSMEVLHDRSNGLGGGFAGYGIYPRKKDFYALHVMYDDIKAKEATDVLLDERFDIDSEEVIPTRKSAAIPRGPFLWRYFVKPRVDLADGGLSEEDYVIEAVMLVNAMITGAFIFSSGKNMGAFKAVGYPEDVGKFYRLDEYEGYTWIGHGRFPTNTPGWWGGAHPFTILDWAIVHNGEISSYGINKRYLEMFGYKCTMLTDTEVVAYLFDLLLRRHNLPLEVACKALAAPFWTDIDRMKGQGSSKGDAYEAIRMIYGGGLLNGPFAIILGHTNGMVGLSDRVKLRPLVAARKDDMLYIASEESAIREVASELDVVWSPKAGEPVVGELKNPIKKVEKKALRLEETVA
ncbi:MAG TPA: glutamine amidotransferase family protein [Anaerolineae bacterium]|nr:glutamine amidotransferase family protein [Anaerolineae bacterium]